MYNLHLLPWRSDLSLQQYVPDDSVSVKVRIKKDLLEDVYELRVPLRTLTALVTHWHARALMPLGTHYWPVGPHMEEAFGSCEGVHSDEVLPGHNLDNGPSR
ncbi:hypothetical protein DPSP01_006887 [Paraphaeosphaeria sporulosa]